MKDLDFRKQLIINEFKTMSKGKSKEEILPLLLALIEQVKDELTEQERQMLPQILALIGK